MFPRRLFVFQDLNDEGSGGGGEPGASDRTNDPTPKLEDFDWESEFKAVSNKLDGEGENGGNDGSGTEGDPPAPGTTPSPAPAPAPTSPTAAPAPTATPTGAPPPVDHNSFPRSWSKDLEPVWGTIPEAARQQIHKREQDVLRGINYYKQGHDFASAVAPALEPYKELIQEGAIEPKALVTNLLKAHYLLANSEEDQRVGLFRTLMDQYGVPAQKLLGQQQQTNEEELPPAVKRHIEALQTELNRVKSTTSSIASTEMQRQRDAAAQQTAKATQELETMLGNTEQFPFANELLQDMYRLVASGVSATLQDAYEQAQWANPQTRGKLIEKQAEARRLAALKARQSSSANVVKEGVQGQETDPSESLDETLQSTLKKLRAAG
jgi:hypothetical protein